MTGIGGGGGGGEEEEGKKREMEVKELRNSIIYDPGEEGIKQLRQIVSIYQTPK